MHKRTIIGLIVVAYVLLFMWLFDRHFAPRGVWSTTRLVSAPFPQERVEKTAEGYRVKETPVYFEVNNPRKFDRAEITFRFRGEAPIIEAGVVKSEDPWRVEMRTLYHEYLEGLEWPRVEGAQEGRERWNGYVLWQRQRRYNTVQEFIENPPAMEEVAVVDAPLPSVILRSEATKESRGERTGSLDSPSTSSGSLGMTRKMRYDVSLRGSQNIYLYTDGEDIEVQFLFHDVNRHDGEDKVEVMLEKDGEAAAREILSDDGIEWGTGESRAPREFTIRHTPEAPGLYRLKVFATDDVFIRRIVTAQAKLVFKGQLYLGDEVQYGQPRGPLTVYSNGQGYALRTPHPESVQNVEFVLAKDSPLARQRTVLELFQHNIQYSVQMPREVAGDVVAITTPKRDLIINSDGFFALSPDAFFLPEPISYNNDLDLDRLGVNYVLARYTPSKEVLGWRESTVTIGTWDADPATPLRVVLSTPIGGNQNFEVSELRVKLAKPRLTPRRIVDKITELWAK